MDGDGWREARSCSSPSWKGVREGKVNGYFTHFFRKRSISSLMIVVWFITMSTFLLCLWMWQGSGNWEEWSS